MYCNQCGKEIAEQSIFCNFCGARITTRDISSDSRSSATLMVSDDSQLEKMIGNLGYLIKPIKNMEAYYAQYNTFEKRVKSWETSNTFFEILGISLLIGGGVSFVISLFSNIYLDTEGVFNTLFKICFVIVFIVSYRIYGKRVNNKKKEMIEKNKIEANRYYESGQKIMRQVYPLLNETLPQQYWYSHAIEHIYTYLKNYRASSMKEAINLYEEEMYRIRMEDMQNRILIQNQRQTTFSAITAFNTTFMN